MHSMSGKGRQVSEYVSPEVNWRQCSTQYVVFFCICAALAEAAALKYVDYAFCFKETSEHVQSKVSIGILIDRKLNVEMNSWGFIYV